MTTIADYTAEQVLHAIYAALRASDMPAVASLLKLLAVKDPASADLMLCVIDAWPYAWADKPSSVQGLKNSEGNS